MTRCYISSSNSKPDRFFSLEQYEFFDCAYKVGQQITEVRSNHDASLKVGVYNQTIYQSIYISAEELDKVVLTFFFVIKRFN